MTLNSFEKDIFNAKAKVDDIFKFIKENSEQIEAHKMEQHIFREVLLMGLSMMNTYFNTVETNDVGPSITGENGVELKRHSVKSRKYISIFGDLDVERQIYWAKGSGCIAPLDQHCNLPEQPYSYFLQEIINGFSVDHNFSEAQSKLRKLFQLDIGGRQIEELPSGTVEQYDQFYDQKPLPKVETEGSIQVLSFDGKGVPMIKKEAAKIKSRNGKGEKRQKKKEALVGVGYTVDCHERTAEQVAGNLIYGKIPEGEGKTETIPVPRACNIRRIASLEKPKEEVVGVIMEEALKRNPGNIRPTVVLLDGSLYLKKIVDKVMKGHVPYTMVLDIIHVIEYLYIATHVFHKENTKDAKAFVYKLLLKVLNGKTGRAVGGLKQMVTKRGIGGPKAEAIGKVVKYLSNHKSYMKYDEYLSKGFPIGTGVVESSCKQVVKGRMEGAGMRWSMKGAEGMLLLRSILTSKDMGEYHKFRIEQEKLKLYKSYKRVA